MSIFSNIFGDGSSRFLASIKPLVGKINELEEKTKKLSDRELKNTAGDLRRRLKNEKSLDDLLPEVFARVREAAKRTLKQRHFDVQLLGGISLYKSKIIEMRTGEGKTLAATLPACLNAVNGKGVHIITVNDYLAARDAVWMGQIYHALGLSVGCLQHDTAYIYDPSWHVNKEEVEQKDQQRDEIGAFKVVHEFLRPVERKEVYRADILYGTNSEFGFDYLRDNLVFDIAQKVQRGHAYAIIDEVDSVLIDEARTPLIISQPDIEAAQRYQQFARLVADLKENEDYNVDEKMRTVILTDKGTSKVEESLGVKNLYGQKDVALIHHLESALKAKALYHRDRDYVIKKGEVIIVDEFTGRLLPGRRYSEGIHQAIEAKEGVPIQRESKTLATITIQNYFRMYKKLAGMTGTAKTSEEEFFKVYGVEVVTVPTHKPMIRDDKPDLIFRTAKGKWQALVKEIQQRHKRGQPVLLGTVSVEKNEFVSDILTKAGIPHRMLNAKHHEQEGEVIAQAGRKGAVTVATNMAGRGVDIILGGNPPSKKEQQEIKKLGGLHVIGTERHEARRIDDQLRGRAGRQGDPGSSQFFLSLEDDLMRIFAPERMKSLMERFQIPEDQPIEHSFVSKAIEQAQSKIEGFNFDIRKNLLRYDDIINTQRETIYRRRTEVLRIDKLWQEARKSKKTLDESQPGHQSLKELVLEFISQELEGMVTVHTQGDITSRWNVEELIEDTKALLGEIPDVRSRIEVIISKSIPQQERRADLVKFLLKHASALIGEKEKKMGEEMFHLGIKTFILRTIDFYWTGHLDHMAHLRESVRLRAYGQRDPFVEYTRESRSLFQDLLDTIRTSVVTAVLKMEGSDSAQSTEQKQEDSSSSSSQNLVFSHPQLSLSPAQGKGEPSRSGLAGSPEGEDKPKLPERGKLSFAKPITDTADPYSGVGRNDPCPCGSGKKFKKCHGK